MKIKMATKLVLMGILIAVVGNLLRGHDLLAGVALLGLFAIVMATIVTALIVRRGGGLPPNDGGAGPAGRPVPSPSGGRPPKISAMAEIGDETELQSPSAGRAF